MSVNDAQYEEIGRNYRFFLSWRYGIFGAFLMVVWSSFSLAFKLANDEVNMSSIGYMLIFASIVCVLLSIAEKKTRDLYRVLCENGALLESNRFYAFSSIKSRSQSSENQWSLVTHSAAQDILAYICFFALFNTGGLCFYSDSLTTLSLANLGYVQFQIMFAFDWLVFIFIDPLHISVFIRSSGSKNLTEDGNSMLVTVCKCLKYISICIIFIFCIIALSKM
jgi:hypothetical protein